MIMKPGDHLVSARALYTHHGIYIGDGCVIHNSGLSGDSSTGTICLASLDEFANGNEVTIKQYIVRMYDHEETCERAHSRLGEDGYSVFANNCEHFATWCVTGCHSSSQVNTLVQGAALASGGGAGLGVADALPRLASAVIAADQRGAVSATSVLSEIASPKNLAAGAGTALLATAGAPALIVAFGMKKLLDRFWD